MRPFLLLTLAIGCNLGSGTLIAGTAPSRTPPPAEAIAEASVSPDSVLPLSAGRYVLGSRVVHANLAVWPILDTRPSTTSEYVTLADALANGSVTVKEMEGGSVPQLEVKNGSDTAVFLAAGDVVTGGKQDRVLTVDVILPPRTTQAVAVNCVEHGRWSEGATGTAFGYGGRAESGLKQTLHKDKDQGRTWEKVAELNAAKRVTLAAAGVDEAELAPSTGTYKASLDADAVRERALPYERAVAAALTGPSVVGVVVAIDGTVAGAELFGAPSLMARSRDALARSLALDAISRGSSGATPPPNSAAATFLADAVSAKPAATVQTGSGMRVESKGAASESYDLRESDGDVVHLSTYRQ